MDQRITEPVGQRVFFPVASRVFEPPAHVPEGCKLNLFEGSYEVVNKDGTILYEGRIIETRKPDDL